MGYIIGGQKRAAIVQGTNTEFTNAKQGTAGNTVETVPSVMPKRTFGGKRGIGGMPKTGSYQDVTRTAPLFNDPRYTSSTLAIPTDNRTLNGLYRFFAETDPIVGAGLKIHCLPAGENILTENGMTPVEQLTGLDKVIGKTGDFQRILATEKSLFVGDLYSVKIMGSPVSKYTDNHPFLVIKGKRIKTRSDSSYWGLDPEATPQVVQAKNLAKGDFVLYPKLKTYKLLPESIDLAAFVTEFSKTGQRIYTIYDTYIQRSDNKKTFTRYIKVDADLAELFGWYTAEGCGAKNNSILHFSLNLKKEKEIAARIQLLLKRVFGVTATISERSKVGLIQVYTCSSLISKFFGHYCGNGSHNKKIPDFIMYGPNDIIKAFFKAYFAGDGCQTDKYDIHIVTVSETLAFQLVRLASKLNVFLRLRPRQKDIWVRTQWYIDASNISFYEKVLDKKVTIKAKQPTQYQEDDNYFYIPIKKVSHEKFEGDVYDIRTEDSWFLNHCLIHNSELPVADLALGTCEDDGVQRHYEEMWERINGVKTITDIVSEYHEIGDCISFGAFNETDYMWDQFAILNPDYVKIESTWINQKPLIKLIPDDVLKRIVQTQSPRYIFEQLPPEIARYVLFNQEIPLAPNNTFHIAYAKRPYEPRGRSIIKRIIKVLMLEDRFMQAEFALATRHAVPLTIVKLGDQQLGWVPSSEETDEVRDMMSAYELDPNFTIIWHYGIDVQYYGSNGKMLPVGPELDRMYRLKFIGMGIHEQLLTGAGGNYSQAYVNMEIQRQRYLNLQLKVEEMVHAGWFKVVADLCGFYKVHNATAGYGGVKNYRWGSIDERKDEIMKSYTSLRDYQDNSEFQAFITRKAEEQQRQSLQNIREYVYPELDWGGMSAANDENLKNYIKWLTDKRPYLVDDATLAKLAKLDRDKQEDAYIEDLKRAKERYKIMTDEQLLPFASTGKGGGGGGDFGGGMPDLGGGGLPDLGGPGGDMGSALGGPAAGGAPNAPIGQGGPPEAAAGGTSVASSLAMRDMFRMKGEIADSVTRDDIDMAAENKVLMQRKAEEHRALVNVISRS